MLCPGAADDHRLICVFTTELSAMGNKLRRVVEIPGFTTKIYTTREEQFSITTKLSLSKSCPYPSRYLKVTHCCSYTFSLSSSVHLQTSKRVFVGEQLAIN